MLLRSSNAVDPSTGEQHAVGPGTSYEAQAQELSALDEKRNIYYIVGMFGLIVALKDRNFLKRTPFIS